MPTTSPRINMIVNPPAFKAIKTLARRDGVSLSQKANELVLTALELEEDYALGRLMDQSLQDPRPAISLAALKKELKLR